VLPSSGDEGVSTDLIRRVLDDVSVQEKRVINSCPVVHSFVVNNPGYAELIDAERTRAVAGNDQP